MTSPITAVANWMEGVVGGSAVTPLQKKGLKEAKSLIQGPKVPDIPSAPKISDAEVQKAAAEEARRRKMGRGYRSTILGQMIQNSGGLKQTLGG